MNININKNSLFKTNQDGLTKLYNVFLNQKHTPIEVLDLKDINVPFFITNITPVKSLTKLSTVVINCKRNALFSLNNIETSINYNAIYELPTIKVINPKDEYFIKRINKIVRIKKINRSALGSIVKGIENSFLIDRKYKIINKSDFYKIDTSLGLTEKLDLEGILKAEAEILEEIKTKPREKIPKQKNARGFIDAVIFAGIIGFSIGLIFMSILAFLKL